MSLIKNLALCAALLGPSVGCVIYNAPVKPPPGWFVQQTRAPLTVNLNGNPCGPHAKVASESHTSHFKVPFFTWMSFSWDEATIDRIARAGGIKKIAYADYEIFSILGIFVKTTVYVHGS